MKKAIISGSFDPITIGHINLIERSLRIFDRVLVCIVENTEKKGFFTTDEKVKMAKAATQHFDNVEVIAYDGMLTDIYRKWGADCVVRGARDESDFSYEKMLYGANKSFCEDFESIILPSDENISFISSTVARDVIKYKRDLKKYIPAEIIEFIKKKYY